MSDDIFDRVKKAAGKAADEVRDKLEDALEAGREKVEEIARRIAGKEVTIYPTYAYRDGADENVWVAPVRVWVHDNRDTPFVEDLLENKAISHFEQDLERSLADDEKERLRKCLADFIADDKDSEVVEFTFEGDAGGELFRVSHTTNRNGLIEENFRIPDASVRKLRAGESSPTGWLTVRAVTGGGSGEGRINFLEPEGLSVISDIDDTIKVTQVPAGKKIVLRNTFLKEYRTAEGMLERYEKFGVDENLPGEVSFHYVSGSPWQMFRLLHEFLINDSGFPEGTFHMKSLRKNLLSPESLSDIKKFVLGGDLATLDQKIRQITNLLVNLPRRKFILVGDSGEKDPEVFRAVKELFGEQVIKIYIRDVLGDRLKGMERITGEGVGVSLDTSEIVGEMKELIAATRREAQGDKPPVL